MVAIGTGSCLTLRVFSDHNMNEESSYQFKTGLAVYLNLE